VNTTRSSGEAAAPLSYMRGVPLATGDTNENPPGIGFFDLLMEDLETHSGSLRSPGFWALAVHRFGNLRMGLRSRWLRVPLGIVYRLAYHLVIAAFGIDLPYNSKIGRRLRIGHHGCLHIGARVIGNDVYIHHLATIGLSRRSERSTAPVIGDRVEIGPGACIVGGIEVGDDCYVGANTVLGMSIPAGASVLGVPARLVDLEEVTAKPL